MDHVRHRFRFSLFALIGGGVLAAGLALQIVLVRYAHLGPDPAYAAQAVFSIELSYLLNRYLTWRDRSAGWWAAAWKFNVQKLLMTVVNLAAYALLVRLGLQYVIANLVLTAVCTPVNYFAADLLVFARGGRAGRPECVVESRLPEVLPVVSVVIPCKASEGTIRQTVDSFLAQDYAELAELILVGDVGDSTWSALTDVTDSRLVLLEQEKTQGRRDPNVKRDKGIRKSRGDVIALADSDVVVDPGWVGRAVALLNGQGGGLVAGGMRSIDDTFWGRFVDNNVLAAKTPRVPRPYEVTAQTFGARGHKPPVTANAIFARPLYDACSLDIAWSYGYEDYEWFWRLAKSGHAILFSSELTASHHHRRSFRHLLREYRQSAHGCAQFIRAHPESPLARKRALQAFGLPLAAISAIGLAAAGVASGYGLIVGCLTALAAIGIHGREAVRSRSLESLTYPPVALALGGVYAATIAGNLLIPAQRSARAPGARAPGWNATLDVPRRRWWQRAGWPLAVVLALQGGISLSLVWRNTAFGDEALYLWAGHLELQDWLHGTRIPAAVRGGNFRQYFSGAPQLYPPLAAAADSLGHLAAARILSLLFMLGATVLLYLTARRLFSPRVAVVAAALWATSEPCLKLGAFATFDAMAVFFVCLGMWLAVCAGRSRYHGELIAGSAVALVLGALTAYSYLLFVPVVIAVAGLSWGPARGRRRAVISAAWLAGVTVACYVAAATAGKLWSGLSFAVLDRKVSAPQGYLQVISSSWSWQGIVMSLAIVGAVAAVAVASGGRRILVVLLAASCLLVPFQQARIQTGVSLDKHLSLGIWLAAMAAGYGIDALLAAQVPQRLLAVCGCVALAFPAVVGATAAQWSFQGWNNSTALLTAFNQVDANGSGKIAAENFNANTLRYYTSTNRNWTQWATRWSGVTFSSVVGQLSSAQLAADVRQYRASLASADYGTVIVSFNEPTVYALTQTTFAAPAGSAASDYNQEVVQLLANNKELSVMVTALLGDHAYKIVAIAPYGRNGSQEAAACVIWRRVAAPAVTAAPSIRPAGTAG